VENSVRLEVSTFPHHNSLLTFAILLQFEVPSLLNSLTLQLNS
jgi:hypothetical protein